MRDCLSRAIRRGSHCRKMSLLGCHVLVETLLVSRPHHIQGGTSGLAVWEETLKKVKVCLNALVILLYQHGSCYRWIVLGYVHRHIVAMEMLMLISLRRHCIIVALGVVLLSRLLLLSREYALVPLSDCSLIEFLLLVLKQVHELSQVLAFAIASLRLDHTRYFESHSSKHLLLIRLQLSQEVKTLP